MRFRPIGRDHMPGWAGLVDRWRNAAGSTKEVSNSSGDEEGWNPVLRSCGRLSRGGPAGARGWSSYAGVGHAGDDGVAPATEPALASRFLPAQCASEAIETFFAIVLRIYVGPRRSSGRNQVRSVNKKAEADMEHGQHARYRYHVDSGPADEVQLETLRAAVRAGVRFMAEGPFGRVYNLLPEEVATIISSGRFAFWADRYGVSEGLLKRYLERAGLPQCAARTAKGERCRNFVQQADDAPLADINASIRWFVIHDRAGLCRVHRR